MLVVHNAGHVAHALSVSGPGLAATSTPTIQPGATKTLKVTLGSGTFTLWCPVGGHAAAGMKTSLAIRGSAAAPVLPSMPTTTDSGNGYGY